MAESRTEIIAGENNNFLNCYNGIYTSRMMELCFIRFPNIKIEVHSCTVPPSSITFTRRECGKKTPLFSFFTINGIPIREIRPEDLGLGPNERLVIIANEKEEEETREI